MKKQSYELPAAGERMQVKWFAALGAVYALFSLTSPAFASNGDYGHYIGFRFIGSSAQVDDTTGQNFSGPLKINKNKEIVAGNALIIGYRWKSLPIRSDIEIAYRYRFDHDLRDTGIPFHGYENNLATLSGLINLTYEYRNSSKITPYFGFGVGWAQNHASVRLSDLSNGGEENFEERTNNLAWAAHLGITWRFADRWDTNVGYRFINLGELESGRSNTGNSFTAENYFSHDALWTVNYRF